MLARHLVAVDRDEEAARALRRAFDSASDRVDVANNVLFLVRYHHDRKQAAQASRIAEDAAGTGSGSGLETMGLLLEWRGRLPEAEDYFKQIETRYDDTNSLVGFYHRMSQARRGDYPSRFDRLIRATFPAGLEKLEPERLPSPPRDGVRLSNPGADAGLWGLKDGDIVVGLDGWRVHNKQQYLAVIAFDYRPEVRLYVWRSGRHFEVPARMMNRYLPLDFETYPVAPVP